MFFKLISVCKLEDEHEKFERLQMAVLMANPDSAPFYKAQLRRRRRVRNHMILFLCSHFVLAMFDGLNIDIL